MQGTDEGLDLWEAIPVYTNELHLISKNITL